LFGSRRAVDGVSFAVDRGICYGLLGPNGAGKTTTISMIGGTVDADGGEILLEGQKVARRSSSVKARIGFAPQDLALYEELSAEENLAFFGSLYGLAGRGLSDAILRSLQFSGLEGRRKSPVRTFSGGMKRRLNIGCAVLHDPDLLILDEPTVGVDPQSRNQIFEALEQLLLAGKTILYTTHYMEEVERLCKRAAIMDEGRVIAEGTLSDLYVLAPSPCRVDISFTNPVTKVAGGGVAIDERTLQFEVEDFSQDLPRLISQATTEYGSIRDVTTRKTTLEEVFLGLTGKNLRDE
jgi:ABC-2 type transport system ATP-binding protein